MRRPARALALTLALAAGCAREPYLYEAWDRVQFEQGRWCDIVTDDPKAPPVGRCEVIEDPLERDYAKMRGRKVLVRIAGGPLDGKAEKIRRGNLRPDD